MTATVSFYAKRLEWPYEPYYTDVYVESGVPPFSARYTFYQNGTPLYTTDWERNHDNRSNFPGVVFYPTEEDTYSVSAEIKDLRGVVVTASSSVAAHEPTEQELDAEKARLFHDRLLPALRDVKEPKDYRGVHYYKSLGDNWSALMAAMSALTMDFIRPKSR